MKRLPGVYFCHQYGGNDENKDYLTEKMRELSARFDFVPISPIHNMGFLYDVVDYDKGLEYCERLLLLAKCLVVFGDKSDSTGCRFEKNYCKENDIEIVEYDDFEEWYKNYMGDDYVDKLAKKEDQKDSDKSE